MLGLRDVVVEYRGRPGGPSLVALSNITFSVGVRDIVALMGANGSGKTTFLRVLAGLQRPSSGERVVSALGRTPRVEFMFQNYRATLFPWHRVRAGIRTALRGRDDEVEHAIANLEFLIPGFRFDAYPHELSGGEQQAVALAISTARCVDLLLLDEPFGALDVRARMRAIALCRKVIMQDRAKAVVFTTHSAEDAAALAQRVVLLRNHPGLIGAEVRFDGGATGGGSEVLSTRITALRARLAEVVERA